MTEVSIIIAAYRAERYIESSIRSALSQTVSDIEVIAVDDGSDDGTGTILRGITDSRLRVISQDNQGQSAALNRGAAAANGRYLKFLDADDQLNARHIAAQLRALQDSTDHLASCRWGYFVDDATALHIKPEHTNRDYDDPLAWVVDSLSLDEGMMGGWMWLIPRGVWERSGGWNERLSLNNDFDFSIRLLLSSRGVRFASDAVYSYREGVSQALSGRRTRAAMESAFLTTKLGCAALLRREDSARIRRLCANRWQRWLYVFYPDFMDLAADAEAHVNELGGSDFRIEGGRLLKLISPVIGWRAARQIQVRAYRAGWSSVLQWKTRRRLAALTKNDGS
jgi:glycosyltransferase involved in cell wall biosynthesis